MRRMSTPEVDKSKTDDGVSGRTVRPAGRSGHTGQVSSRLVAVLTLLGPVSAILLAVRLLPMEAMLVSGQ